MSEGLKPCPFCGKTASLINCPEEWNEGAVVVACDSCGGSAPVVFGVKDDPNPHARELWNTRPIEDALRARVAELEVAKNWLRDMAAKEAGYGYVSVGGLVTDIEERENARATGLVERGGDASSACESRPATGSAERGTVEGDGD